MKRFLLQAALVSTLAAGTASAASLSFIANSPLVPTELDATLTLGLFDSSLGTLTGVGLTLSGQLNANITLNNNSNQSNSARATATSFFDYNSTLPGLNLASTNVSPSVTTGIQTIGPGGSASFPGLSNSASETLSPSLSLFGAPGGGSFQIRCRTLTGLLITGGGGFIGASFPTQAACGAEIVYTYTPGRPTQVPEPGALALLAVAALGGAGFLRRKRA